MKCEENHLIDVSSLLRHCVPLEDQCPAGQEVLGDVRALPITDEHVESTRSNQSAALSKAYACCICSLDPGDASPFALLRSGLSSHRIEYHLDEAPNCSPCDCPLLNHEHDQHWMLASNCSSPASGNLIQTVQNEAETLSNPDNLDANSNFLSPADLMQDLPLWASQFPQGACVTAKFVLAPDQVSYQQSRHSETSSIPELGFGHIFFGDTSHLDDFKLHQHWHLPFLAFLQCLRRDWPKVLGVAEIGYVDVRWVATQAELRSVWYITPLTGPEHHFEVAEDGSQLSCCSDATPLSSANFQ